MNVGSYRNRSPTVEGKQPEQGHQPQHPRPVAPEYVRQNVVGLATYYLSYRQGKGKWQTGSPSIHPRSRTNQVASSPASYFSPDGQAAVSHDLLTFRLPFLLDPVSNPFYIFPRLLLPRGTSTVGLLQALKQSSPPHDNAALKLGREDERYPAAVSLCANHHYLTGISCHQV